MRSSRVAVAACVLGLALIAQRAHAPDCRHLPAPDRPHAAANDNRTATGTLRDGVVTLSLVMREVSWYPDGPNGCGLRVHAFAVEGQQAQIPGPLIRIRAGTEVRVSLRNALASALWVRGLQARNTVALDSTEVAPGVTREFRFRADEPGAWYYWAGGVNARVPASNEDGQLVGALVVDPAPEGSGRARNDRVFVMTRWTPTGTPGIRGFQLNAINGQSWPGTERLTYTVGDSVRWHVINASDELHMMHLHGFYYRIEERGDAAHDSALSRAHPATVVTAATRPGEWVSMVWSPDRAGNWLFHCHFVAHMSGEQRLDRRPMAESMMAGLLLGISVRPAGGATSSVVTRLHERTVDIFANTRPRMFGERPGYGFVVQDGAHAPAADSISKPAAPLLLTRGEPVRITVHNRHVTPLTVHWHGIELESYSDGVGGWSGIGKRIAPMIAPGDSFVAHFTPTRAGTFIYHVHNEHGDELASGLYAPLLVLEPGKRFDPQTEKVFLVATGGPDTGQEMAPFINGTASPDTLVLSAGTTYRLRLIDISANQAHVVTLRGAGGPAQWRALARDGRDLPSDQAISRPSVEVTASGVTRDFEFSPATPGNYTLAVASIVASKPTGKVTTVPIRVAPLSPVGDFHQHLFGPGILELAPTIPHVLAADLIRLLDSAGIRSAALLSVAYMFSNPNRPAVANEYARVRAENDWTAEQAALYPDRLRALCSVNPTRDYALDEIERCSRNTRLRFGLKLHFGNSDVELEKPEQLERVTRVFRAANARGMAIVVHMHPSVTANRAYGVNYARLFLTELLAAAPNVPIQIAHLTSSGNIDEPGVDSVLTFFAKAIADGDARMKNVYFDISGLGEIAGTPERATRVVTRLRQLGLNRILFGSDGAVMGNSPLVSWTAIRKLPLTAEEFDTIARNVPPYMR